MLVHYFDLVAFEHRYIRELARFIATVMFDNEKSRRRYFEDEGQRRDCSDCSRQLSSFRSRQTPRCIPGRSTASATRVRALGSSGRRRSNMSGCTASSGERNANEILGT